MSTIEAELERVMRPYGSNQQAESVEAELERVMRPYATEKPSILPSTGVPQTGKDRAAVLWRLRDKDNGYIAGYPMSSTYRRGDEWHNVPGAFDIGGVWIAQQRKTVQLVAAELQALGFVTNIHTRKGINSSGPHVHVSTPGVTPKAIVDAVRRRQQLVGEGNDTTRPFKKSVLQRVQGAIGQAGKAVGREIAGATIPQEIAGMPSSVRRPREAVGIAAGQVARPIQAAIEKEGQAAYGLPKKARTVPEMELPPNVAARVLADPAFVEAISGAIQGKTATSSKLKGRPHPEELPNISAEPERRAAAKRSEEIITEQIPMLTLLALPVTRPFAMAYMVGEPVVGDAYDILRGQPKENFGQTNVAQMAKALTLRPVHVMQNAKRLFLDPNTPADVKTQAASDLVIGFMMLLGALKEGPKVRTALKEWRTGKPFVVPETLETQGWRGSPSEAARAPVTPEAAPPPPPVPAPEMRPVAESAKQPWEMTETEYLKSGLGPKPQRGFGDSSAASLRKRKYELAEDWHKLEVRDALASGKRVPNAVVEEYLTNGRNLPTTGLHPDLAAKYGKPPTPAPPVAPGRVEPKPTAPRAAPPELGPLEADRQGAARLIDEEIQRDPASWHKHRAAATGQITAHGLEAQTQPDGTIKFYNKVTSQEVATADASGRVTGRSPAIVAQAEDLLARIGERAKVATAAALLQRTYRARDLPVVRGLEEITGRGRLPGVGAPTPPPAAAPPPRVEPATSPPLPAAEVVQPPVILAPNPYVRPTTTGYELEVMRSGRLETNADRGGTWYENVLSADQPSSYGGQDALRAAPFGVGGKEVHRSSIVLDTPYLYKWPEGVTEGGLVVRLGEEILGTDRMKLLRRGITGTNAETAYARIEREVAKKLASQGYDGVVVYQQFSPKHPSLPVQTFRFAPKVGKAKPVPAPSPPAGPGRVREPLLDPVRRAQFDQDIADIKAEIKSLITGEEGRIQLDSARAEKYIRVAKTVAEQVGYKFAEWEAEMRKLFGAGIDMFAKSLWAEVNKGRPKEAQAEPISITSERGISRARIEAERTRLGLEPIEVQPFRAKDQSYSEGKSAVDTGALDVRAVAQEIADNPRPATSVENGAFAYVRDQINTSLQTADVKRANELGVLDELIQTAARKGGREWGATGQSLQHIGEEIEPLTLGDVLSRARQNKDSKDLTQAELEHYRKLQSDYEKAKVANDRLTAENTELQKTLEGRQEGGATNAFLREQLKSAEASLEQAQKARKKGAARGRPAFGSTNTIFTQEVRQAADAYFAKQAGILKAGIDPEGLKHLVNWMGYEVEATGRAVYAELYQTFKQHYPQVDDGLVQAAFKELRDGDRLDTAKKSYKRRIEQTKETLAAETPLAEKPPPFEKDVEYAALKQELHRLRADVIEHAGMEKRAQVSLKKSEVERQAAIAARLRVRIADVDKRIADRLPPEERQLKVADTPEITRLRGEVRDLEV